MSLLNPEVTELEETVKKAEKRVEQIKEQVAVLEKAKGAVEMLVAAGHGNTDDGKEVIASIEKEITMKKALLHAFDIGKEAADIAIRQGKEQLEEEKKEGADSNGELIREKDEEVERIYMKDIKGMLVNSLEEKGDHISFREFDQNFNGKQQALMFMALRSRASLADATDQYARLKDNPIERSKLVSRLAYTEYIINQAVADCLDELADKEEDEG